MWARSYSASSKLVLFDSLPGGFLLVSYSNFVSKMHHFETFIFKKCWDLETPGKRSFSVFGTDTIW